jgi:hypothetical protein
LAALAEDVIEQCGHECTHGYRSYIKELVGRRNLLAALAVIEEEKTVSLEIIQEVQDRFHFPPTMWWTSEPWKRAVATVMMEHDLDQEAIKMADMKNLPSHYQIREINYNWGLIRRCQVEIDFPDDHDDIARFDSLTEALGAGYRLMKEYNGYDLDPHFMILGVDRAGNIITRQEIESERETKEEIDPRYKSRYHALFADSPKNT